MKTTLELPDQLFVAAKKRAAELRCPFKDLVERGLRRELSETNSAVQKPRRIRWITVDGGLPAGLDIQSREFMHGWLNDKA